MTNTDWKNDFGPFETETDKYYFWRFLLKKSIHLGDRETNNALYTAFVEWCRRSEDEIGAERNKLKAEANAPKSTSSEKSA